MKHRWSRRRLLHHLGGLLLLGGCLRQTATGVGYTSSSQRDWQIGIGADPERYTWETRTNSAIGIVAQVWSPHFLSAWLNSFDHRTGDLSYWRDWHRRGLLRQWFKTGYSLHIITWEDDTTRPTGDYHISPQLLADLAELAGYVAKANPRQIPTYWTLATEFSYWRVPADTYNPATSGYYQALMANLIRARQVIQQQLPQAWVAPSWGGWIVTFDNPETGAGRSMIPPFSGMMRQMDGIAFQAMRQRRTGEYNPELKGPDPGNPAQILQCCQVFSRYTGSLMVSHYEPAIKNKHPNGGRADTVSSDFSLMTQVDWLQSVTQLGLDKFALMHYGLYKGNPYDALRAAKAFREAV